MVVARAILGKKPFSKLLRTSGHGPTASGSFPGPRPSPFDDAHVPRLAGGGADEGLRPIVGQRAVASRAPRARLGLQDFPLAGSSAQGAGAVCNPRHPPTGKPTRLMGPSLFYW